MSPSSPLLSALCSLWIVMSRKSRTETVLALRHWCQRVAEGGGLTFSETRRPEWGEDTHSVEGWSLRRAGGRRSLSQYGVKMLKILCPNNVHFCRPSLVRKFSHSSCNCKTYFCHIIISTRRKVRGIISLSQKSWDRSPYPWVRRLCPQVVRKLVSTEVTVLLVAEREVRSSHVAINPPGSAHTAARLPAV